MLAFGDSIGVAKGLELLLCKCMARNQCELQRAEIASGPDANRVRVAVFSCMLFLCMSGWLGCQKSQPNLLGSAPSYLRPYSPGAPMVPPEGASVGPSAPYSGSPYSGSPYSGSPQAAAPVPQPATPSAGTSSIASAFGFPSGTANPASDPTGFGYAAQISELERRAKLLDENNRQLHSQLAQSQQQVQTYRERSDLMQQQLGDMSAQLQQARIAAARPAPSSSPIAGPPALPGVSSLATSSPALPSPSSVPPKSSLQNPSQNPSQRSGARLTANTSGPPGSGGSVSLGGASSIEPLRSLGYPVETNGTSLRVRIPADQLFQPGSSQWTASAGSLLERVSNALRTASPNAQLLIDSYTDNSTNALSVAGSAEQLTSQQADAVMRYFVSRGGWNSSGVTIRSNGSEGPLMDNQSPSGRAANRRIEFILTEPL
ncbi:MAG: OmpA family protein [Pirellula sp.]|nr:OmpA family protein [Pirellula sp.]